VPAPGGFPLPLERQQHDGQPATGAVLHRGATKQRSKRWCDNTTRRRFLVFAVTENGPGHLISSAQLTVSQWST
jgi:hypothetical protein